MELLDGALHLKNYLTILNFRLSLSSWGPIRGGPPGKSPPPHTPLGGLVGTKSCISKVYLGVIRPILEYAVPVWQRSPKFPATNNPNQKKKKCFARRFPQSSIIAFGRWLTNQELLRDCTSTDVHEQTLTFTNKILEAMHIFFH